MNDSYKNNKSTYKMIESDELVENEIKLEDFVNLLLRRKKIFIITSLFIFTLSLINTAHKRIYKPVYSGGFDLLISDPINSAYKDSASSENGNIAAISAIASNTSSFKSDIPTLIAYLNSPVTLKDLAKKLDKSPRSLGSIIKIEPKAKNIGALKIRVRVRDFKFGEKLIKELGIFYLSIANEQRRMSLGDGLLFLNKQEPNLRRRTNELQDKIAAFQEKYTFLSPDIEGSSLKKKESNIEDNIIKLQKTENYLLNIRKEIIKGNLSASIFQERIGPQAGAGSLVLSNNKSESLINQILELEKQLSLAKTKFTENSKKVKLLQEKMDKLRPKALKQQIRAIDIALDLNNAKYQKELDYKNKIREEFQKKPNLIKEYNFLTQSLLIAKENLTAVILARENFQLKMAQNAAPWRLLSEPSMSTIPVDPNISTSIFYGLILSALSGLSVSFIRDRFNYVYRSRQDLEKVLKIPLLGNIPFVKAFEGIREKKSIIFNDLDTPPKGELNKQELNVFNSERFFYQESFRSLYTSFRFLGSDKSIKSISFSSSLPTEGKSLISIMFAKTLAELGKKVLLIDADMRKPQIHTRLGMNNISGLSNIISSDNLEWQKCIQTVKNYPSWKVISSGVKPPDPTRLISSKKMGDLVKDIDNSNEFDLVIYDTPPILGLSDAVMISEYTDGITLIVSLGKVNRDYPKESIRLIKKSNTNLLGIISNSTVKSNLEEYSNYAYKTYENYADKILTKEPDIKNIEEFKKFNNVIQFAKKVKKIIYKKSKFLINWLDN